MMEPWHAHHGSEGQGVHVHVPVPPPVLVHETGVDASGDHFGGPLIGIQHDPCKQPDLGLLYQSILGLCNQRLLYQLGEVYQTL